MSLVESIKSFIPFLSGPKRLPPDLLRSLHPVRSPRASWTKDGNPQIVVVSVPRPPQQGWKALLAKLIGESPQRRFEISDEIGAAVWDMCDGEHTVRAICREIGERYTMGQRQTEVSVLQFLNMLLTRGMIGIPAQEQVKVDAAVRKPKGAAAAASSGSESYGRAKQIRTSRKRRH